MLKKISFFIYKILNYFDKFFQLILGKSYLIYFKEFIEGDNYINFKILNKNVTFFTPNVLTKWRVQTFYTKEPETLVWIDKFKKKNIFWDIGANIGLYSIYNSLKNKNSKTISFEPSTSNLRILSRNIYLNKLYKKIIIFPIPLFNKNNKFLLMKENDFVEGGALNSFGVDYNFEGKKFKTTMQYKTIGMSINYLLEKKILQIPDYIKIDVDGIEHFILLGGNKFLKNKKIKSICIEVNENFTNQYRKIINIMKINNFKILKKKRESLTNDKNNKFVKTYNYFFIR